MDHRQLGKRQVTFKDMAEQINPNIGAAQERGSVGFTSPMIAQTPSQVSQSEK